MGYAQRSRRVKPGLVDFETSAFHSLCDPMLRVPLLQVTATSQGPRRGCL